MIAVIGHHTRTEQAHALADSLEAHLFMDTGNHGAAWNHRRALEWGATHTGHLIVLEDDAQPVDGFAAAAEGWIARYPDDLISFYLGTGRPRHWQTTVGKTLAAAERVHADWIGLRQLIHAVSYTMPTRHIPALLERIDPRRPADYGIGDAWRAATSRHIIYPIASLVDHADTGTVETHPDGQQRTEPRRARRLYACQ